MWSNNFFITSVFAHLSTHIINSSYMVFTRKQEFGIQMDRNGKTIYLYYISIYILLTQRKTTRKEHIIKSFDQYIGTPIGVSRQRHELSSRYRT
jgi:hypothetical protein